MDIINTKGKEAVREEQGGNRQQSDKLKVTTLIESLPLLLKAKQLPPGYSNWPYLKGPENAKIRVDNIPDSVAVCWARALRFVVLDLALELHVDTASSIYAFLTFPYHSYAARFVEKFDKKQISGTSMVYQLSWAPFLDCSTLYKHSMFDAEKSVQPMHIDADSIDNELVSRIYAFHEGFREDIYTKGSVEDNIFERQGVRWNVDDGRTTVLCLTMVDPCVEENYLKSIFEEYGECTVNLSNKGGCGLVYFKQRTSAQSAFDDLATLLKDENVCYLLWAVDQRERCAVYKKYGLERLIEEGFRDTPYLIQALALVAKTGNHFQTVPKQGSKAKTKRARKKY